MSRTRTKEKSWVVKTNRPEEMYGSSREYYTRDEVEKYNKSSHMRRTQRKLTARILDLMNAQPPAKVLDIGCAVGYSTELLKELGYDVIGFDINEYMLEKARERGLKVIEGDIVDIEKYFRKNSFDYVISTSTFQWIKDINEIKTVGRGIYYLLKPNGQIGIQFYPKSEKELNMIYRKFERVGFHGDVIIDSPESIRKRTTYLIMEK